MKTSPSVPIADVIDYQCERRVGPQVENDAIASGVMAVFPRDDVVGSDVVKTGIGRRRLFLDKTMEFAKISDVLCGLELKSRETSAR